MPTAKKSPIVDLYNPAQMRAWLRDARAQLEDVLAAGRDATRPPADRVLSDAEAQRQIVEAGESLRTMLDAVEHALDGGDTRSHP